MWILQRAQQLLPLSALELRRTASAMKRFLLRFIPSIPATSSSLAQAALPMALLWWRSRFDEWALEWICSCAWSLVNFP